MRQRISVERINRMKKIFLILKHTYHNKIKRFGLRVNLLAAINNKNIETKIRQLFINLKIIFYII